ncbi:MAG: type II toxin-antitoxin system YoeB family toxin [Ruminococcus sp.]|nr:type II toxin-antitoxin system YoeB family toxin [Ruminococcus sp.]
MCHKKLLGNLNMCYSRRINAQHRLVYMVDEGVKTVKIISMRTHYE